MTGQGPSTELSVSYRLSVNLGATPEERAMPQTVWLDLSLFFPGTPSVCTTDQLEETINYADICYNLQTFCMSRRFHMLEFLSYELYKQLRPAIDDSIRIILKASKRPPNAGNQRGRIDVASFTLDDRQGDLI